MTRTNQLVPGFTGPVVFPESAGYDSTLLRCRSRADVIAAVRYAVGSGVEIAVR